MWQDNRIDCSVHDISVGRNHGIGSKTALLLKKHEISNIQELKSHSEIELGDKLSKFNDQKYAKASNFETELFPEFIRNFNAELVKLTGFWHSVDNIKDIKAIDDKKNATSKYFSLKKIKKNLLA